MENIISKEFTFNLKDKTEKENLSLVTETIQNWMEESDVGIAQSTKISVCCDEILSNVIYYSGAEKFVVAISKSDHEISVVFSDDGKPFNPLEKKDPDVTLSAEDREIGGLGIFMVKKMMTSVDYEYCENRNVLTMKLAF